MDFFSCFWETVLNCIVTIATAIFTFAENIREQLPGLIMAGYDACAIAFIAVFGVVNDLISGAIDMVTHLVSFIKTSLCGSAI